MDSIYLVPVLFFFISFLFSMLGMGGSQLYVPVLFWLGMDFKTQAIPLGMLLNVINSSSAAFTYIRKGLVNWKIAFPFSLAMVIFAPVGTWWNRSLSPEPLIVIFSIFTAVAGALMLSGWKPKKGNFSRREELILALFAGALLGFFAGLIGRGGGSFVVPLLYAMGLEAKIAVATSSFIITCSGTSSFLSHVFSAAQPQWTIWLLSSFSVLVGSQVGSTFMATKLDPRHVKLAFGLILIGISFLLLVHTFFL